MRRCNLKVCFSGLSKISYSLDSGEYDIFDRQKHRSAKFHTHMVFEPENKQFKTYIAASKLVSA